MNRKVVESTLFYDFNKTILIHSEIMFDIEENKSKDVKLNVDKFMNVMNNESIDKLVKELKFNIWILTCAIISLFLLFIFNNKIRINFIRH